MDCLCGSHSIQCHGSTVSLSDSLKCFPSVLTDCPDVEISPLLQLPQSPDADPAPLTLLLFFPSFFHPTEFCMALYIPFPVVRDSCQLLVGAL